MAKKKLPSIAEYPDIEVERKKEKGGKQYTYFLKIPFAYLQELKVSIANRSFVNLGSGLYRQLFHDDGKLVDPNGLRTFGQKLITDKDEIRGFHWTYDEHMEKMGIIDDHGAVLVPAYVNGLRDLGQNSWHIFWQQNPGLDYFLQGGLLSGTDVVPVQKRQKDRWFRLLEDDIFGTTRGNDLSTGRVYSCLAIPIEGTPRIQQLRFDEKQDAYSANLETKLSDSLQWAVSGKALVHESTALEPEDILEQYCCDPAHIFPISKDKPVIDGKETDRPRESTLTEKLFQGYPASFRNNCLAYAKSDIGKAKYYFDILGVNDESLMILHYYGTLKEAGNEARRRGMKEAIVVDEGGSIATWAWHHGPDGGFENVSSYFRASAIALLGIFLKNPGV